MQTETAASCRRGGARRKLGRHLHRLARILGTATPPSSGRGPGGPTAHRAVGGAFPSWHYWWQAHLFDLLVDAEAARPGSVGRDLVAKLLPRHPPCAIWAAGPTTTTTTWRGRSGRRAGTPPSRRRERPRRTGAGRPILRSWAYHPKAGIPWRTMDCFFNTPANGPGAIPDGAHRPYRSGRRDVRLDARKLAPDTGLIYDGIKGGRHRLRRDRLGNRHRDLHLLPGRGPPAQRWRRCAPAPTVTPPRHGTASGSSHLGAIETHLLVDADLTSRFDDPPTPTPPVMPACAGHGSCPGAGGGDGGLFAGIRCGTWPDSHRSARRSGCRAHALPGRADRARHRRGRLADQGDRRRRAAVQRRLAHRRRHPHCVGIRCAVHRRRSPFLSDAGRDLSRTALGMDGAGGGCTGGRDGRNTDRRTGSYLVKMTELPWTIDRVFLVK